MTDALEARQEAHSIWDAAGDRYRSGETHRCLSHLHCFARDRDLAWEHAWLAVQKLGGTDSAELAMTRLRTLLLYSPRLEDGPADS